MTEAAPDALQSVGRGRTLSEKRIPWLLVFFCILIEVQPSYVLLPRTNFSLAQVISWLMFALLCLGLVTTRRRGDARVNPGVVFLLAYMAIQLVLFTASIGVPDDRGPEKSSQVALPFEFSFIALYVMLRTISERARRIVLAAIAISIAFACVVGVLQVFAEIDLRLLFKPPGWVEGAQAGRRELGMNSGYSERYGGRRAFGTYWHSIQLSMAAAVAVPLSLHYMRYASATAVRRLAACSLVLALLGIIAAGSRTGVVSLVVALAVYGSSLKLRRFTQIKAGTLLSAVIALIAINLVVQLNSTASKGLESIRIAFTAAASSEEASAQARLDDVTFILDTLRTHPILGLGVLLPSFKTTDGALDNTWLTAIMFGGMVGVCGLALLGFAGFAGMKSYQARVGSARERDQAFAIGAMFFGLYATTFVTDTWICHQTMQLMFVLLGLLWSNYGDPVTTQQPDTAIRRGSEMLPGIGASRTSPRGPRNAPLA